MEGNVVLPFIPANQRRTLDELDERLDLTSGDHVSKRSAFWLMLVLSSVIAAAGVCSDSTATVIGAMIVAPLSTPILAVGLATVTGRGHLLRSSVFHLVLGIVVVIAVGFLFAQVLPNPTSVLDNSQVRGRTSPTLMDLLAALATGLVGAIAITRRDVGDVLPGVAIAISLVPPLAVTGVCLGSGEPALGLGALVLFASNVVAMIITATVVLVVAGYRPSTAHRDRRHRGAYVLLGVTLCVVAVPMVVNSLTTLWAAQITTATENWLRESPRNDVTSVTWQGHVATIAVFGPEVLPPLEDLRKSVADLLPFTPELKVVHDFGVTVSTSDG